MYDCISYPLPCWSDRRLWRRSATFLPPLLSLPGSTHDHCAPFSPSTFLLEHAHLNKSISFSNFSFNFRMICCRRTLARVALYYWTFESQKYRLPHSSDPLYLPSIFINQQLFLVAKILFIKYWYRKKLNNYIYRVFPMYMYNFSHKPILKNEICWTFITSNSVYFFISLW